MGTATIAKITEMTSTLPMFWRHSRSAPGVEQLQPARSLFAKITERGPEDTSLPPGPVRVRYFAYVQRLTRPQKPPVWPSRTKCPGQRRSKRYASAAVG